MNQYPKNVTLYLTEYCEMKCAFCSHAIYPQSNFKTTNFNPITIKEIIQNSETFNIAGDGEVLYLNNFLDYIPYTVPDSCNLFFSTSIVPLTTQIIKELVKRKVTHIYCSIDAGDRETYNKMRGPYWNKLWHNLEKLIEIKKDQYKPIIKTTMMICNSNIHTLPKLVQKLIELKNIECLLIYRPEKKAERSQWCNGGEEFFLDNELAIDQDKEYKYILEAIDIARNNNFNLVSRDRFLNYEYQHRQM